MKIAIWLLLARCTACIALRGAVVMRACVSRRGAVAAASAACATLVSSAPARGVFDTRSAGGLSKKYADTGVVRKERVDVAEEGRHRELLLLQHPRLGRQVQQLVRFVNDDHAQLLDDVPVAVPEQRERARNGIARALKR